MEEERIILILFRKNNGWLSDRHTKECFASKRKCINAGNTESDATDEL